MTSSGLIGSSRDSRDFAGFRATISTHYSAAITQYGPTPLGVDWICKPTQELRFVQLLKFCDMASPLSINDFGCGYGALFSYLKKRHADISIDYMGVDIAQAMVVAARRLFAGCGNAVFRQGHVAGRVADYSVASGIFNVKFDIPTSSWIRFVKHTLDDMRSQSKKGFAVNFLKPPPPRAHGKKELYRTSSAFWRRYCADRYGAQVDVLSDYGMREFTLLARYGSG